jgi:hypothetical protein
VPEELELLELEELLLDEDELLELEELEELLEDELLELLLEELLDELDELLELEELEELVASWSAPTAAFSNTKSSFEPSSLRRILRV